MTLTNLSENTFRRRIADGTMSRTVEQGPNGRSMIAFEAIRQDCCVPVGDDELRLIADADQGEAAAQNALALFFLSHHKEKNAVYWLELAVKQKDADAMHWLGRCYIDGKGVAQDEDIGVMWLARAASEGHVISREIMQSIRKKVLAPDAQGA